MSIADRIARQGGVTSGFDYARLALALGVMCFHSVDTSWGPPHSEQLFTTGWRGLVLCILPMFFALSGFLVAGSLQRVGSLTVFATYRLIRIVPALAVEILLSALIIGPLFTNQTMAAYFSHELFRDYFLNIVGVVQLHLPGVFATNPRAWVVNGSLWTVPYEFYCYAILLVLAALHLIRYRLVVLLLLLSAVAALAVYFGFYVDYGLIIGPTGAYLVISFLLGVLLHLYREKVPYNAGLFAACILLAAVLLIYPRVTVFACFPLAYIIVYLGLFNPRRDNWLMRGDYSYGIYLFAYPIQQAYAALFPAYRIWWMSLAFAVVCSLAYAFMSWHLVEHPLLRRKQRIAAGVQRGVNWLLRPLQRLIRGY